MLFLALVFPLCLCVSSVAGGSSGEGRIVIKAAELPAPFATPAVNNGPRIVPKPDGVELKLPEGFKAEVVAEGFENPRWIAVAPNGDMFVVESGPGRVTVLRETAGGIQRNVFATGLTQPFGIAFWKDYVYVANTNSVVRFGYKTGQIKAEGPPEVIIPELPGYGYHQHWTRDLMFNPRNGKLYVSVGSHIDIGEETDARRAALLECNPDGSGVRVYASGLRNAVGLALNPANGMIWAAVNERDNLGDDLVPDYVTSIQEGGFYGWPYYYIGPNHDPRMPERPELQKKALVPDILVQAHSAALGLVFYEGKQFPKAYHGDAFVALHGSANRSKRTGYKIIRIPFRNGKPLGGYEDFLTGWMLGEDDARVWGRPVGLAVAKDGSLLVVDDGANKLWRISYKK